ncbi:MAG TPA: peptidase [Myxococcota bacterium]|nr:peptidase [Myxococcota bacterium]HON24311.1 peptidase [Myxococcota bacterium]HOS60930.1 peptidase [Myxococcota bacterium]HPC90699.1 peptidase [Myxococcota bacterium]HPL24074.1 peptidase [Myxococcota bacterium]
MWVKSWKVAVWMLVAGVALVSCRTAAPERGVDMAKFNEKDVAARRAQFVDVTITVDPATVSAADKQVLTHLINAAQVMGRLFWVQASDSGTALLKEIKAKAVENKEWQVLAELIDIHAGPWDRLDDNAIFYGQAPKLPGAAFYPADMTVAEFEKWIADNPDDKESFQSGFTLIRRQEGRLVAIPYSKAYEAELTLAASELRKAADLTSDATLAAYLRSRADAFLSDDYYESDMLWMDLGTGENPSVVEVTIGPYEVYEDNLFNLKTAFEAFVTLTDVAETEKLKKLEGMTDSLEANLPIEDRHKNFARGTSSPIRVVNVVYTAGDTRAGVQTLAFNLPNDERVRHAKGSKKVMLKNVGEAKYHGILEPIAKAVLAPELIPMLSFDAYFNFILMHEISHGLGPGFVTAPDGSKITLNVALKETYSGIEECKADALAVYNTMHLVDTGFLPADLGTHTGATYLAGLFRSVRFGISEAHGVSNIMQYNFLKEFGGITYDEATGLFGLNYKLFVEGIAALSKRLLEIEALGDLEGARAFIKKYGFMPPEVAKALEKLAHIPVDIRPVYTYASELGAK